MSPAAIVLAILVYVALLGAVAWISGRRTDNVGFFTGNRRTPWGMAAFAMIGAAMSGVTFLSVPGSVATDSFSYLQMVAGFTVGQLIVAFMLIPLFYRLRITSLYEYLAARFGSTTHRTGAWCFFLSKMTGASLRLFIVCTVMQALLFDPYGLPFGFNIAVTVALIWLYTRWGGVRSLIQTDMLKTLCMVASLLFTIVCISRALGFTTGEMVREVAESPMSRIFFFDDPASERYFWKMFFAGIVLLVAMTGLDQDMMQRNLSCPTPHAAQKNILLTALCQIFVILLFLVLGVLLYRYAEYRGMPLPEKSDQLFSQIAVGGGLPLAAGLLFIVGLFSSTCSSAGASLTALTTSFTVDILRASQCDPQRLTRLRQRVHLAMALCLAAVVLCFGRWADESVINLFYKVAGYTYGPILGFFLFGMVTRRAIRDRWSPLVTLASPLLSLVLQWVAREAWDYHIGFELLIYNAAFTVTGLFLLSRHDEK